MTDQKRFEVCEIPNVAEISSKRENIFNQPYLYSMGGKTSDNLKLKCDFASQLNYQNRLVKRVLFKYLKIKILLRHKMYLIW